VFTHSLERWTDKTMRQDSGESLVRYSAILATPWLITLCKSLPAACVPSVACLPERSRYPPPHFIAVIAFHVDGMPAQVAGLNQLARASCHVTGIEVVPDVILRFFFLCNPEEFLASLVLSVNGFST